MESHCYAPMSAIRRLSLSLVAPPSAILECEEEGRTEWAQAEQGRADSLGIIITLSCSRPSGRVFLPSPCVSFSPSCPSFFYHRRGSLISFLFVRVAFNKLAFDFLPRLVQQPLCLAPVNSPAFDNRPRPTYALSLLSSSCPPILLLRLFLPPPPFHVYTPRVPPFIQSSCFFFLLTRVRDAGMSLPCSLVSARRRSSARSRFLLGPKTRNRGARERIRVKWPEPRSRDSLVQWGAREFQPCEGCFVLFVSRRGVGAVPLRIINILVNRKAAQVFRIDENISLSIAKDILSFF